MGDILLLLIEPYHIKKAHAKRSHDLTIQSEVSQEVDAGQLQYELLWQTSFSISVLITGSNCRFLSSC